MKPELKKNRTRPLQWQHEVRRVAAGIRRRVLEHTIRNNGGYLSQACSSAEILATLYVKVMNIGKIKTPLVPLPFPGVPGPGNPASFTGAEYNGPKDAGLDRFFLSPAQYALVLYATLIETGRMDEEGLSQFNKDGSVVEMIGAEHSPGMETMTGSLGQGISQAAGVAMARMRKGETGRVFLFMSDGEFQIGQTWEAIQAMSFHRLDNVVIYVDVNGFQCDGKMTNVMNIEPLDKRLAAFGCRVIRVNGHDITRLAKAGNLKPDGRPVVVLADTDACRGMTVLKSRMPKMHYVRFASAEEKERYRAALEELCGEVIPLERSSRAVKPSAGPEILSRVHAKNLVRWAAGRPNVLVLSADLTSSTEIDLFRDTYPDRFLSMGIAEQNMLSFAAGLAREGFIPFVHTFAVFIYRRAFDQIAMSVAYSNLPVRMIGFLPGITTPGGATHQAIEDVAVMRALPNMTILECGDATEVESVLDVIEKINGPVYVRMLRGEIPRLFNPGEPMKLGRSRVLSEGGDVVVLSSGIMTEEAMRAVQALQKRGLSIQHMHISTLKPFIDESVTEAIARSRYGVITMENHTIVGGLGSIVAEQMAELGMDKRLTRLGLNDTFAHGASKQYLMKKYRMDAMALITEVEALIKRNFGITESELKETYRAPVHSTAKAEAL
jgi:transketolase